MPVLGIDTSSVISVALVGDDGRVLARRTRDETKRHAELLSGLVAEVLDEPRVDRRDLTAIVAGTGPAPFTGLRAGLVTARVLAAALGIPVLGVPSVDALAAQAVADLRLAPGDEMLVATDARRREVYWARYEVGDAYAPDSHADAHSDAARVPGQVRDLPARPPSPGGSEPVRAGGAEPVRTGGPEPVRTGGSESVRTPGPEPVRTAGPEVAAPGSLEVGPTVVVGRGGLLYPAHLPLAPGAPIDPDPATLVALALGRRDRGIPTGTEPLYLRRPDVSAAAGAKRVTG